MIVVRRTFAIFMTLALIGALTSTLLIYRANQTVLSADFYTNQLAALGAFDAIHDEVLPTALNDFLVEQDSKLPENLADVALPTDAASQQLILDFARTAVPPEYLESVATEGVAAFIAYLTGQRDELNWNLSFNQPVESAFGTASGGSSAFEQTWTTLDLTAQAFDGLSAAVQLPELEAFKNEQSIQMLALFRGAGLDLETSSSLAARLYEAAPEGAAIPELTARVLDGAASEADLELLQGFFAVEGVPAAQAVTLVDTMATEGAPSEVTSLSLMLGEEQSVAIEWFQGELFGAVRELTAYLTGASDSFAIQIDFSAHPEIAEFAAGALKTTPEELISTGYGLTGDDINAKLAAADSPPVESIEIARAWFTPAGRTLSIDDLQNRIGDPATPTPDGSIDTSEASAFALDTARSIIGPVSSRGLLLGAFGVLLIAFQISMLGGRQWWSRAVWGTSALAAAAFAIFAVAGPVYSAVVSPLLSDAFASTRTDLIASDNAATSFSLRALDQLEAVINQQVGAVATNALVVGVIALLLASAVIAVHVYLDRRDTTPEASPEPITLDATPDTTEERVAA
ncbi:MAG: hypothetical protein HOH95_13640 [Dehalococcoidia bacterium]|nr:hypothetical protein [Dehalococcoidia bacterium]